MRVLSVCSGIEAASVAWTPLGWQPWAFAEIDPFPSAVLAHHYPDVPNLGDMTQFKDWPNATLDVLVGGTPCQSFSVAGLRQGLADPRGNLALTYLAIADRYRPRWLVWENVPGVLSSDSHHAPDPCPPTDDVDEGTEWVVEDEYDADESHAFACFLAGLSELGYGFAYGSLNAQYFGLAQRRERVFVVGYLGDWRRAAAVLFERESLSGHPPPGRETGEVVANAITERPDRGGGNSEGQRLITGTLSSRASAGGGLDTDFDIAGGLVPERARALTSSNQRIDYETETLICADVHPCLESGANRTGGNRYPGTSVDTAAGLIAHALRADGFDASEDGTGRGTPIVPMIAPCLTQNYGKQPDNSDTNAGPMLVAFSAKDHGADCGELSPTLRAGGHSKSHANGGCMPAVAFHENQRAELSLSDTCGSLKVAGGKPGQGYPAVAFANTAGATSLGYEEEQGPPLTTRHGDPGNVMQSGMQVRRLTPRECERLQGFPDDYTLVPYRGSLAKDGPRYKALGNSMAVPCMRWIGERIQMVDAITVESDAELAG
jgi:DNA (cytosine-5)-methyltransferase 1